MWEIVNVIEMAASYLTNVPRLKGRENFDEWSFAIENFMILEGLKGCIEGKESDEEKIAKAKAKIVLTIDTSLYVHIKDVKTAKELWDKLQAMFDDKGFTRRISLLRALISLRLENCDSMSSYVNQLVESAQKLRGTGFKIDDEWIGSLLLAGLPEKFAPMIMAIEHSGITITTDVIKTKLLDMGDEVSKTGSAFAGKWNGKKYISFGKIDKNSSKKKEIRCYNCNQLGHYKNKCPQLKVKSETSGNDDKKNSNNAFSAVFLTNGKFNREDWYVDSGASAHLTVNEHWIKDAVMDKNLGEITVANNSKVPVVCTGNIDIKTEVNGKKIDVVIKNALCVPNLTTNLLSVSQLIKKGNRVIFSQRDCQIYNSTGELIATADLEESVYKLNIVKSENNKCFLASASTWHRRLGHVNYADLKKLNDGAVQGITCKDKVVKQDCVVCCEGKQSRPPFNHQGTRATDILEVIHGDVCGPMEEMSIGGSKYFLILEDDYTRMCFVYFLKSKDEVFKCFQEFKQMVENQKGKKIKIFRTDNGGEFCSNNFEIFLKNCGIIHQTTNPYTPQQNGLSERMNRTIVERARCLLYDAKAHKKLWAEAVNTAVYIRNRCIAAGLENKTPYEMWHGRKPNLGHMKIFGSTAMVQIPNVKRNKFDKKAEKMILVGYGQNTKGYRLYNPLTNAVVTSRDVMVLEGLESDKELQVQIDSNINCDEIPVSLDPVGDTEEGAREEQLQDVNDDPNDEDYIPEYGIINPDAKIRKSSRQPKPKVFEDYATFMTTTCQDPDL